MFIAVTTQVLLPEGLAIRVGMKHNTTEGGDAFLADALIGRQAKGAEVVTPGRTRGCSYTDLRVDWEGHSWRIQTAHNGGDLVILVTPLESKSGALRQRWCSASARCGICMQVWSCSEDPEQS